MKRLLILALLSVFLFCSCAINVPEDQLVCNNIPADSYSVICQVAALLTVKTGREVEPEQLSKVLQATNLAGLATNRYTASSANLFLDTLIKQATVFEEQGGVTWATLVTYAIGEYKDLPPTVQASFIIAQGWIDVPEAYTQKILSGYDWQLILRHLNKQKMVVLPFTLVEAATKQE